MSFLLKMPKLSPTMKEGNIVLWHQKEGDYVEADSLLLEIATDKAVVEHSSLDAGYLRKILVKEGMDLGVGEPLAVFTLEADEDFEEPEKKELPTEKDVFSDTLKEPELDEKVLRKESFSLPLTSFTPESPLEKEPKRDFVSISPLARKIAKDKGLSLEGIRGTGARGRILEKDLEHASQQALSSFYPSSSSLAPGSFSRESLSPLRKKLSEHLTAAKASIPHFYLRQKIDVSSLVNLRQELKGQGHRFSLNDLIVKALAMALHKHPPINSGFDSQTKEIIRFQTVDIALAVGIDGGIITPILRKAEEKNLKEISLQLKTLIQRARQSSLQPEEYKGGSFTLSNLGMYGIDDFTAILNPPQAAILAVGAIVEEPLVKEGKIVIGKTMSMTLSCDHRVIDGAEAASFMKELRFFLENSSTLLLY